MTPALGRNVLYTLSESDVATYRLNPGKVGDVRCATIVRVWPGDGACNLQVFLDGDNDNDAGGAASNRLALWLTSRLEGTAPGTWAAPDILASPPPVIVPPAP
jgi:hypothetical protein